MRIRPPHNPDILTYRDSVVYAPDRIQLEQRRLSSSVNANGTFIDTYFLTLTILRQVVLFNLHLFQSKYPFLFT
jgi:hypothetical protein